MEGRRGGGGEGGGGGEARDPNGPSKLLSAITLDPLKEILNVIVMKRYQYDNLHPYQLPILCIYSNNLKLVSEFSGETYSSLDTYHSDSGHQTTESKDAISDTERARIGNEHFQSDSDVDNDCSNRKQRTKEESEAIHDREFLSSKNGLSELDLQKFHEL